jgi:predicted RNase H-like HicB family nuclease
MYWAQVEEWPGGFASGATLDELTEALEVAIVLYATPEDEELAAVELHIREMTLKVGAERPLTPARRPATGAAPGPLRNRDPHATWPLRGFHRRGGA